MVAPVVMRRGRNGIESGDQIFTTVLTTKKDHVVGNCALLHISKAQLPNRKRRGVLTQNAHVLPQPPTAPWLAQVSLLTALWLDQSHFANVSPPNRSQNPPLVGLVIVSAPRAAGMIPLLATALIVRERERR